MKKDKGAAAFFAYLHGGSELAPLYTAKALHINCGKTSMLEIQNCTAVLEYDEEKIKIGMGEVKLLIEGDMLMMDTLSKGSVTVHGRIFGIHFIYEDDAK